MRLRTGGQGLVVLALALVVASCADSEAEVTTTTQVAESSTTSTSRVIVTTPTTTTLPPPGPSMATLGDKNATVEAIQFLLNCNGYGPLTVDGSFGPATQAAVQAAQSAAGLAITGAPDEEAFAQWSRSCAEDRPVPAAGGTVVGNAASGDPERFPIALPFGSTLTVSVFSGVGATVTVSASDGTPLASEDGTTFGIESTGGYVIEVGTSGDAVTFNIEIGVVEGAKDGDWVLSTRGISYRGTTFTLGEPADPIIEKIFEFLDHGVRGGYGEFDTGWDDPGQLGFRGIFIEGFAFLFYGPNTANPGRPETLGRVRYVGPSRDAGGDLRPPGYLTTGEGITVGNTLADLKTAYGSGVAAGSNAEEHYYRYSASGGVLCFYFGADPPADSASILEISTECRT